MANFSQFFRSLSKIADEAGVSLKVFESLPLQRVHNFQEALMDGSKASLNSWLDDFIENGKKYSPSNMSDEVFNGLPDAQKAEGAAFRALTKDEWDFFSNGTFRAALNNVKGKIDVRADIEKLILNGETPSPQVLDDIAKKHNLDIAGADKQFYSRLQPLANAYAAKRAAQISDIADHISTAVKTGSPSAHVSAADLAQYQQALAGMDDTARQAKIASMAEDTWKLKHSAYSENADIHRQHFSGRLTDEAASVELVAREQQAAAAAQRQAQPAAQPQAAQAQPAAAAAGPTVAGASQTAKSALSSAGQKASEWFWPKDESLWGKVKTMGQRLGAISTGVTVPWFAANMYLGRNDDMVKVTKDNPIGAADSNLIEDIGDAKWQSDHNSKLERTVSQSFETAQASLLAKRDFIENALKTETRPDAIRALKNVQSQVNNIIKAVETNPDTAYSEMAEEVKARQEIILKNARLVAGLDDNMHGQTAVAAKYVADQSIALIKLNEYATSLHTINTGIDDAIENATSLKPASPKQPLDKEALAHMAKFDAEQEQKFRQAITNAALPLVGISEIQTKSADNVDLAKKLVQRHEDIINQAKDTSQGSLSARIAELIDLEKNRNNDPNVIARYTALQTALDELVNTTSQKTQKDIDDGLAAVEKHHNYINTLTTESAANQILADQGNAVNSMSKSVDGLKAELDAISSGVTNWAAFEQHQRQKQAAQTPVTGGQPPVTGGQPPVTGGQPPVTGGQPPVTGGQPPVTGGQPPANPAIPQPIKLMIADAYVLSNHNGGKSSPATLSGGQTQVEFGIGRILSDVQQLHARTRNQIAEIETLQINLNKEGKGAEAAELTSILRDLRNNEVLYADSVEGIKAAGLEARKAVERMEKYTQGADIPKAQQDLAQVKTAHANVITILNNVNPVQVNQMNRLKAHPLTEPIIRKDTSLSDQSNGSLMKNIDGGDDGLTSRLFGQKGADGMTVAGSYFQLAKRNISDLHDGWKNYGRSMNTQGGQTGWMIADTAGKVVLGAIALNLFNNTLGAASGFQIDGWKRLAVLGLIAAVAINGTSDTAKEMNEAIRSRSDAYGNGPLAQTNGGGSTGRIAGTNIPDTHQLAENVPIKNQKTGEIEQVASIKVTNDNDVTLVTDKGKILQTTDIDVASLDADVTNRSQGNGNIPANMDTNKLVSVSNTDTPAANDELYNQKRGDQSLVLASR